MSNETTMQLNVRVSRNLVKRAKIEAIERNLTMAQTVEAILEAALPANNKKK